MRKLLRKFVVWVMGANNRNETKLGGAIPSVREDVSHSSQPKFRLAVIAAANGRILEMSTFKRNNHGPDWKTEYYILEEGRLAEQIAVVMTMRGMGV